MSYVNNLFPFLDMGDFVRNYEEKLDISKIFYPIEVTNESMGSLKRPINLFHVLPCDVYVLNENTKVCNAVMSGAFSNRILANVVEIDYMDIAKRILYSDDNTASIMIGGGHDVESNVVTDLFINTASNGSKTLPDLMKDIHVSIKNTGKIDDVLGINESNIKESTDFLNKMLKRSEDGKKNEIESKQGMDFIYSWLDSYFALPEGQDMNNGGREVVPLLIGPTGVFKSATVKELCKKYGYRLVDFRVSFTSRLDYSGLFQMGEVDGQMYSYACPMEELVTCSDGFREYCRKAYDQISQILSDGYIIEDESSDGEVTSGTRTFLTDDQRGELEDLLSKYREYMKTPVLLFDEITRTKDGGVEGILVQLLNQKKFNNMTLKGCKFVAATNLNIMKDQRHEDLKFDLDDMYDVNQDLDVAYSNRFMPLKVFPEDVADRWYEWADGDKEVGGKTVKNIHPIIISFLKSRDGYINGQSLLYNDEPVLKAIEDGLTDNEKRAQTYPNYRTWEMLSDYMYQIDKEFESNTDDKAKKVYKEDIINGLISSWAGSKFIGFLKDKGYVAYTDVYGAVEDNVSDFLESTLSAGVPALLIGPSSLGKTSRVREYINKREQQTGLKPLLIDVNLASKDTTDLMGMPTKVSLVDYVGGGTLKSKGLSSIGKRLGNIVKDVASNDEYGMVDTLTRRAPDKTVKDLFKKALDEGREVILMFDECNRVKNPTIMSAMFECISDSRFGGIDFKKQKDQVKIIAACNMAHSEMGANLDEYDEVGDYNNAGSLDPALAARFSVFWKKNYDESDVKSWISFMESQQKEGNIDGTVIEFFKQLEPKEAVRIMASVEKRTIENAESSTRALLQLSKDIKSMRGKMGDNGFKKSLYNGKVIFDDIVVQKFQDVNLKFSNPTTSGAELGQDIVNLIDIVLDSKSSWEPMLCGDTTIINGEEVTSQDLLDALEETSKELKDIILKPMTSDSEKRVKILADASLSILDACNRLDIAVSDKRLNVFESYVGESFARSFLPYFNNVFGSADDIDITIEMLEDKSLITPFLRREYSTRMSTLTSDGMVDHVLELIREFGDVHEERLPAGNYAAFIEGCMGILPSSDSITEVLARAGKDEDPVFSLAEGVGNQFILGMLKSYPGIFTEDDIENTRKSIESSTSTAKKRRTRIL